MKNRKIIYMIMAFLTPIILFLLVMYLRVGTIDGNYIMISDMEAQYNSLFQYLKNVLNGTESLFYSFHKGLGGEMFTTFTYYLSSPLNILVLFFKDGGLPNCILLILLIKLGLSGLTMNIYLNYKTDTNLKINFIFSMCYALMGYTINYYFNIMWLDAIYMLPIIILGLEKVIDEKNPLLYIVSLSYTIICSYYISYMVCLFVLLYFIHQIIIQDKKSKKTIIIFIVSSILSAGISSFILIPTIVQIPSFASTQGDISVSFLYILEVLKGILKNIIIGAHNCSEVSNQYGTYLYITNFCFILYILFLTNREVDKKEKILSIIIIMLFLSSFILLPLTYIWHGFSIPSYLNNRHAFLLNFFIITLTIKSYQKLRKITKKDILVIVIVYILLSIFVIITFKELLFLNIMLTWLFLIVYIYFIKISKESKKKIYQTILFIIIMLEIFINLYLSFVSKTVVATSFEEYVNHACDVVSNNDLNFRTENAIGQNGIDGLTCSYNSVSTFLSTITQKDIEFFHKYGYSGGGKVFYNGASNTTLMDSLLGVKYYYLSENDSKSKYLNNLNICNDIQKYNEESQNVGVQTYCLYENSHSLSIGYMVNDISSVQNKNVFENQNNLLKKITGMDVNVLYPADFTRDGLEYHIKNNGKKFYIYIDSDKYQREDELRLYVNGEQFYKELVPSGLMVNNILEIISDSITTDLKIMVDDSSIINSVDIYQVDDQQLDTLLSKTKKQDINIESIDKEMLKGKIVAEENGYLLFTIPYNKWLNLYIDDVQVDKIKAYDYFIAVKIEQGEHTIKIVYNNKIYYISLLISILFGVAAIFFVKKCKK